MVVTIINEHSPFTLELKRIRFELTENKVPVKFIQDFSGFSFEGIKIPAVSKGNRLEIPFFIAELLLKKQMIEDFIADFPASLQSLTAAVRTEVRSGKLQPLHPYFNILFKDLMEKEVAQESRYSDVEYKRKKDKLNQLIHERVAKILTMAKNDEKITRSSNLTASELILYKKITDLILHWKIEFSQD